MIAEIKSEKLIARIDTMGAELRSVKNLEGAEFMWSGDPAVWSGVAPIMFPICSGLKNDKFKHNGSEYTLNKHGFAKLQEFEVENHSENEITMLLKSNNETKKSYPFDFEFRVNFKLDDDKINVTYSVKNTGAETMYFSLGAHEAYAMPEGIEQYDVIFDRKITLDAYELDGNTLTYDSKRIITDSSVLPLDDDYFKIDALVFPKIASHSCTIVSKSGKRKVKVDFDAFEHLLLWHVHGAKYLCIEPWNGLPDRPDSDGNIENKDSIRRLAKGAQYNISHTITFFDE